MPNGVICGGAVEGSNQLGAIVTCQATTACPDGACWAAAGGVAAMSAMATSRNGRRARWGRNDAGLMGPLLRDWREDGAGRHRGQAPARTAGASARARR